MRVRTKVDFSGVHSGTTGIAEKETDGTWKITWTQNKSKEIEDWFTQSEFDKYLEII
jgi:hypothetical protein